MIKHFRFFIIICFLISNITSNAQCITTPVASLVKNGSFTSGNTQFSSGYSYCNSANCLYPEGYYAIGKDANFYHGNFVGRDHTTGTGNFMIVNGTGVPNTTVWSQNITVKPGTNYNFSAWVMTLVISSPAKLQFQINGATIGSVFDAPTVTNTWQNFANTWNSGVSTTATITILNQNTTLAGNDFGIDDISFIEICGTTQPNLGPDRLLCGVGTVMVDTNVPHTATTNINWSDGTSGSGLGAPYTKTLTAAGTYWVCVQDGSCFKTDTIKITANFSVDIGPDFTLCASTAVKVDAGYGNAFTTYQWLKDGVPVTDSTNRTFTIRNPGTYRVEVTDASCSLMRFDDVVVNAVSALPKDGKYCPPAQAKFEVIPNPTGGFRWYDAPTGGVFMNRGNVMNLTMTGTKTMYAEDTTAFQYTVGPNAKFPAGYETTTDVNSYIAFDALSSFTLNEITVFAKVYNPYDAFAININLVDNTNTIIASVTKNVVGPPIVPAGNNWPFNLIVNFNVPAGTDYKLDHAGTAGPLFWSSGAGNVVDWPNYKVNGIIALKSINNAFFGACVTCYGFAYNWKISKGNNCARVPVTLVEECPLPLSWINFTAERLNEGALLTWSTAEEKNTSHFDIERSSDGKHYKKIGQVKSTGNTSQNNYHFQDGESITGIVYYRIAQYDIDGAYTYSVVRSVQHNKAELLVYPTKHNGLFNLKLSSMSPVNRPVDVYLFSTMGAEVYHSKYQSTSGNLDADINITDLSSGVYLIRVSTDEGIYTSKCIKE
ncbi:MAG: hypothetical protein JWM14_3166 [Chitinophagaceae bacterium]|nr:hypothetical protein [Chitinophagaceae bacterium]